MTKQELEKETDKLNRELEPYIGAIPEVLTLVKQKIWVVLYGDGLSEEWAWCGGEFALIPMGYQGRFTVVLEQRFHPFWATKEEARVGLAKKLERNIEQSQLNHEAAMNRLIAKRDQPIRYIQSHTMSKPLSSPETP